jgi:hypothetical protein
MKLKVFEPPLTFALPALPVKSPKETGPETYVNCFQRVEETHRICDIGTSTLCQ